MDTNIGAKASPPDRELRARCENCFGLCCTALPFEASSDFAATKAAGTPCRHLQVDYRCGVHDRLRDIGYRGCTVFDCFGAGQRVSQETFGGASWRDEPKLAGNMFEAFHAIRLLHELLWYLGDLLARQETAGIHEKLRQYAAATDALASLPAEKLRQQDIAAHRMDVNLVLIQGSELVRNGLVRGGKTALPKYKGKPIGPRIDLMGANLRGMDLRGCNLRGAYLIAADLSGGDLRSADMIGVDLRDTNLCGANLSDSLFLTPFQIHAAKGDRDTLLPPALERPSHWG
jgi:uncharacterized protein YjbI with pentapeptide repeats